MHNKINLSVSSSLVVGLFLTGCSQQQINPGSQQSVGGQQVYGNSAAAAATGLGSPVLDGFGNPVKDGFGGIVRDTFPQAAAAMLDKAIPYTADMQHAPMVKPMQPHGFDHQVQDTMVPHTPEVHHHDVKPTQTVHHMAKPVQKMAKPIQRRSVAYTDKRAGMPPAKPGQCYAKVKTGPTFKNVVKRVQVSPAINKRVLVRGPQYGYVNKRVQVRPATHTFRYVPAQYKTVKKHILVKPAHYAWQKGKRGPVTRIDNMTGEVLCRVKVPAVYKTVVQKVLVRPAKRVKVNIPAVYNNVKQKKMVSPAQYRNINKPARFINKTFKVKHGGVAYKWKPINC